MRPAILLLLSIAVAVPTSLWIGGRGGAQAADPGPLAARAAELVRRVESLDRDQVELVRGAGEVAAPAEVRAPAGGPVGDDEIAAAVSRVLATRVAEQGAAPAAASAARATSLDGLTMPEILRYLGDPARTRLEVQLLFQELRKAGRLDEYVTAVEERAQTEPANRDYRKALANAYLMKVFDTLGTPEFAQWGAKTDAAFDRVLELDDHDYSARFGKAVALASWPDALGKRGEAIAQFEILRKQQEQSGPLEGAWNTYVFLGGLYERSGEREKAIQTWEAGLARFPGNHELEERLAQIRR